MQVLLRKASTLAKACIQAATEIELSSTTRLSLHSFPMQDTQKEAEDILLKTRTETLAKLDAVLALHRANSVIRRLIKEANHESVDRLLNEREHLNSCERIITKLISGESSSDAVFSYLETCDNDPQVISKALLDIRARRTTTTANGPSSIIVPTLDEQSINNLKLNLAAIRRKRNDLNDELAAANLNKKITLPEDVVTLLRGHGIIE